MTLPQNQSVAINLIKRIGEAGEKPERSGSRNFTFALHVLVAVGTATEGILTDIQNMNLWFCPELLFRI